MPTLLIGSFFFVIISNIKKVFLRLSQACLPAVHYRLQKDIYWDNQMSVSKPYHLHTNKYLRFNGSPNPGQVEGKPFEGAGAIHRLFGELYKEVSMIVE
jgi:hypothetical protein